MKNQTPKDHSRLLNFWRATAGILAGLSMSSTARSQCVSMWEPIPGMGPQGFHSVVFALTPGPNGIVVATGAFTSVGGVAASGLAAYSTDTNNWTSVGFTSSDGARALATLSNGDVLVGGAFRNVGDIQTLRVARYNFESATWYPLGTGIPDDGPSNPEVFALACLPSGDVLVGGAFGYAGDVQVDYAARFSFASNSWTPLGWGPDATVYCIAALPNGDAIAGGDFTTVGGEPAHRIARYVSATNSWVPIGSGTDIGISTYTPVYAIALLPDGDVIVGGRFAAVAGFDANNIARYTPSTGLWSPLDSGVTNGSTPSYIASIAVLPNGDLVVGGQFSTAGGTPANNVARYSFAHARWSAIGSGIQQTFSGYIPVEAVAVVPGTEDLVVGGRFGSAGGLPASAIARCSIPSVCCGSADFDHDGDLGTDADIEAFFACIAGNCCAACDSADFNGDGDTATDADIEAFFRVLAGGSC